MTDNTPLIELAKAALDINTFADHDGDCDLNKVFGADCSCGYTAANRRVLNLAEQVSRSPALDASQAVESSLQKMQTTGSPIQGAAQDHALAASGEVEGDPTDDQLEREFFQSSTTIQRQLLRRLLESQRWWKREAQTPFPYATDASRAPGLHPEPVPPDDLVEVVNWLEVQIVRLRRFPDIGNHNLANKYERILTHLTGARS